MNLKGKIKTLVATLIMGALGLYFVNQSEFIQKKLSILPGSQQSKFLVQRN